MPSTIFGKLPWTSCPDPLSYQFPLRGEHHDIDDLEEAIFFGGFVSPGLEQYKLNVHSIGVILNDSSAVARSILPDNKAYSSAIIVLLVYRIFDIMNPGKLNTRLYPRLPFRFNHYCYSAMNNWFQVVYTAHDALQSILPREPFLVDRTADAFTLLTLNDIKDRDDQIKKNKIINNIQIAAMHLAYIKQGKLDFVDEEINEHVSNHLPALRKDLNLRRMRLPLTMAAFITPICLLMPKKLYSMEMSRESILEVWQSLGNIRPPAVSYIEGCLWELLVGLLNTQDVESDIYYTLDKISKVSKELEKANEKDGSWFKDDETVVNNTCFGTCEGTTIGDMTDGEGDMQMGREEDEENANNNDNALINRQAHSRGDEDEDMQDEQMNGDEEEAPMTEVDAARTDKGDDGLKKPKLTIKGPYISSKRAHRRRKKASISLGKRIREKVYSQPTSVQQTIDLTHDWTAPPPLNIDRKTFPMPAMDPSFRLFSYDSDVYLDYSAHIPHPPDRQFFQDVASSVRPIHLSRPEDSVFFVTNHAHFESLSSQEIQVIFGRRHIVVTDVPPGHRIEFDRQGLETLCPWKKHKVMQDFSIPVDGCDYSQRQVVGSLQLLYEHSQTPDGRVLNALDFPLASGPGPSLQIASDLRAWDSTIDTPLAKRSVEYPLNHMRWGLASTKGCQHTWHVDSMGVGTCVQVKNGSKWWVVGRPKDGREDIIHINDETIDMKLSSSNDDIWELEGMLLTPGMTFFMRPNTPHAVFTPQNCIVYGSHFLATSTIRDTCYGIIHSFVSSSTITNTDNNDVWVVLQRLMCYFHQVFTSGDWMEPGFDTSHIPDISNPSGMVDLYTLMVILELANVLHASSYSKQGLLQLERLRIIEARRLSRELRQWVASNFVVQMTSRPNDDVFIWMLSSMCIRLVSYLKAARKHNIEATSPSCTVKKMSTQIYDVISGDEAVLELIRRHHDTLTGNSIKWTEPVLVNPLENPEQFTVSIGFTTSGYTPGDFSHFSEKKPPSTQVDVEAFFLPCDQ